ncbi:MAG: hypothetical protein PHI76_02745, partial [Clostridia bacterium]|nr:hypothetical protein [Clostridia bacterium]
MNMSENLQAENSNSKVLKEFVFNKCLEDYKNLSKLIGKTIKIEYLKNDGLIGNKAIGLGKLLQVLPFKGIKYAGGYIPFLDSNKAITRIATLKNDSEQSVEDTIVYDRSYILNSTSQISKAGSLYNTYKLNVFGTR